MSLKPRIPLIPKTRKRLEKTPFPDVNDLDNLKPHERRTYIKNVDFRTTIEDIEDKILGSDGQPGIVDGDPHKVYGAWMKLSDGERDRKQKNAVVFNSTRTNARKAINIYINKHNVLNGHKSELSEYKPDQIKRALSILDYLKAECGYNLVNDVNESMDANSLVEAMVAKKFKFEVMNDTDKKNWRTAKEEEQEQEEDGEGEDKN